MADIGGRTVALYMFPKVDINLAVREATVEYAFAGTTVGRFGERRMNRLNTAHDSSAQGEASCAAHALLLALTLRFCRPESTAGFATRELDTFRSDSPTLAEDKVRLLAGTLSHRRSCPHPVPRPCNNSTTSTSPHPGSTINSAIYSTGMSTRNTYQTFKAMIWRGLLIIWTGYASTSPILTPLLNRRRFLVASIPPVLVSGNVSANSETYAAPE
jgi:hypothetical protein